MTAVAFVVSAVLAAVWYATFGRVVVGWLSVWQAWYLVPFAVAGFYVARGRELRAIAGWLYLAGFWVVSQYLWFADTSYLGRAFAHAFVAVFFAIIADRRSQLWISALFMGAIGIDFLAYNDAITPAMLRGPGFVVWSYPDLLAGISHAATIIIASPFDGGGKRIKLPGRERGMARHPASVRLHRRDPAVEGEPGEGGRLER